MLFPPALRVVMPVPAQKPLERTVDSGECLSVLFGVETLLRGIALSILPHAHTFGEHVCGAVVPQGAVRGCVGRQGRHGQNERTKCRGI